LQCRSLGRKGCCSGPCNTRVVLRFLNLESFKTSDSLLTSLPLEA
jgi:hypothetical protein